MAIPIDLDNVEEAAEYGPLPAGWYDAFLYEVSVEDAKPGTKSEGYQIVVFTFNIDDEKAPGNRKAWMRSSTSPKALPFFLRNLKGLGITDEQLTKGKRTGTLESWLQENVMGAECQIRLSVNTEYDSNDVKAIRARGEGGGGTGLLP